MLRTKASKWVRSLVWAGLIGSGFSALDSYVGVAHAQPPVLPPTKVEGTPPTLPPTTVEGTPPTDTPLPPVPNFPLTGAPLSSGGAFASPVANGYYAPSATSGTIINVPLIDYPGSIAVIPQPIIRDQQALRINDLIRDIGAATNQGDFRRDSMNIRGFELQGSDNRWNGFLDPFSPYRDLANVQRLEVMKGPASVLYGAGQPSGMINWITKRPLSTPFTDVNYSVGSFGLQRTTIDTTGPLDDEGRFLFRINAAYEDSGSFRDFGFVERTFFAPSFTWVLDDGMALNIDYQYLNDRRRFDTGLISQNGAIIDVPRNRFLNEPNDYQRMIDHKLSMVLYRQFTEEWTGKIGGFVTWLNAPQAATVPFDLPGVSPTLFGFSPTTILRQRQNLDVRHEQYGSVIADVNGKFSTGFLKHNAVVGMELGWLNSQNQGSTSDPLQPIPFQTPFGVFNIPFPSAPLDYNNPVYNQPPAPLVGAFNSTLQQQRYGFYAQDLMDVNEHWKVLAGARFDILNQHFGNGFNQPIAGFNAVSLPFTEADTTFYHTSPRVGIIYQPIPETVAFYGTYALSFDPPATGVVANPGDLRPETGQIIEGGLKMDLLDNKLSMTAAGFHITKSNVLILDPNNFLLLRQVGEQRSQGFEFNTVGQITDRWSVIGNYAFIDARTTADLDPLVVGKLFPNVPFNTANLWTRYNIVADTAQTLGLAAGVVYVGERAGDLANTFNLPSYTRWDAGIMYSRRNMYANLYLENVFDDYYFTGAQNALSVIPGAPFTARAQIGFTF